MTPERLAEIKQATLDDSIWPDIIAMKTIRAAFADLLVALREAQEELERHKDEADEVDRHFAKAVRQRDALQRRVEALEKATRDLMSAVETLMDEVTHQKATKWGIVNRAMVAGTVALRGEEAG